MPRPNLRERIKQGLFLLDGAMGTELFARGIEVGKCNDYLNVTSPNIVLDIHRAYLQAGSDAVLTNTFGANRFALTRHGLSGEVKKINLTGAQIACHAAGRDKYVLGDIGPSGDFLQPLGNLKPQDVKDAFIEQANALLEGGVDGFIIETMTALDEMAIAIEAVKSVSDDLPVFASFAFDSAGGDYRTMMGVDVETAVSKVVSLAVDPVRNSNAVRHEIDDRREFSNGVDALGFNCGTLSLEEYTGLASKYVSAVKAANKDIMIFAEPNAGKPELVDDKAVYKVSPEDFAEAAEKIHSAGINIIGGCCGTSPEHIEALSKKLRG